MKRYVGRVAGTVVGLLAGPPGALLGLLSGWLVDQYLETVPAGHRFDRFLRKPESERHRPTARLYTIATLLAAVLEAGETPFDRIDLERVAALRWFGGKRETKYPVKALRPALERALLYSDRIDPERIAGYAAQLFREDTEAREALLSVLVDAGAPEGYAIGPLRAFRLRTIGYVLDPGPDALSALDDRLNALDPHSCRVLGVHPHSGREEVRRAYRRLATDLHPDTATVLDTTQQGEIQEAFLRVREAYDALTVQLDYRDAFTRKQ